MSYSSLVQLARHHPLSGRDDGTSGQHQGRYGDGYQIDLAALVMKKEGFKLTLHNGKLTVSTQQHEEQDQQGQYTKREFSYPGFSRSFWLPDSCQQDQIQARYEDGILHIELAKKEEAKSKAPTQIQINYIGLMLIQKGGVTHDATPLFWSLRKFELFAGSCATG